MAYFIRKVDTSSNPRDIRGWRFNTLKREREEILSKIAELNSRLLTIETELSEDKLTSEIETITNISKDLKNA